MLKENTANNIRILKITYLARLADTTSLKHKRSRISPIMAGLKKRGSCTGIESGHLNDIGKLELTIVLMAENADKARSRLDDLLAWLDRQFMVEEWVDHRVEWLE